MKKTPCPNCERDAVNDDGETGHCNQCGWSGQFPKPASAIPLKPRKAPAKAPGKTALAPPTPGQTHIDSKDHVPDRPGLQRELDEHARQVLAALKDGPLTRRGLFDVLRTSMGACFHLQDACEAVQGLKATKLIVVGDDELRLRA